MKLSTSVVHLSNYRELMSFLLRFTSQNPGAIARSALYLQLDDRKQKSDHELPKWVPSKRMVAETLGITSGKLPSIGTDGQYFLEQSMIGVCVSWYQGNANSLFSGAESDLLSVSESFSSKKTTEAESRGLASPV